jgi:ketosteroid isomerase-like protein
MDGYSTRRAFLATAGGVVLGAACSSATTAAEKEGGAVNKTTSDANFNEFITRCEEALGHLVEGRAEPFKALWSHADDVLIMGAFGAYERGWEQVMARLDWASKGINATNRSAENIVTVVSDDLAYTVDLEHMTRQLNGQASPRTLRATQAYRREDGQWRVILRHADELAQKDESEGRQPQGANSGK